MTTTETKNTRLAFAFAAAALALTGCAGAAPAPFEDAEELQAFLKAEAPVPENHAELGRLNETFARQAVRAHGYVREGVGDATQGEEQDGWSPVVRGGDGDPTPADMSPWIAAGDIDAAGRFAPGAELCEAIGPVPTDGLAEAELKLEGLQDRLSRLSCALDRLAGGATSITWAEPSAAAVSLSSAGGPNAGGAALVNPRVLHLILPEFAAKATPPAELEPTSAEPGEDEILIDEADIDDDNEHHPRPPPDPDDSSDAEDVAECIDSCAKGCEILITVLDACDDSAAMDDSSSSDCESSVPGQKPGPIQAFLFSIGLVFALGLRRFAKPRRRGGRPSALLVLPLLLSLLHGDPALAQPKPAAAPPPPPPPSDVDGVEGAAPPLPQKDWKQLHQEGMKKLEEKNYGDAIRLLREAYLIDPTLDKLEAIARAQRGAGQTPQAIKTLEHARVQFGQTMTDQKYEAIEAEINKMKAELVKVRVIVTPLNAKIAIDDDEIPPGASGTPIEIAPGPHKFGASAEGYAAGFKMVDIKREPETQDVVLKLPPTKLYLVITAPDPEFAIEIDGAEVGRGEWSGFVDPGAHKVALKHPDGRAVDLPVNGAAGEAIKLPNRGERIAYPGMPEPTDELPPEDTPSSFEAEGSGEPYEFRETGMYFLANVSLLWNTIRPYGFDGASGVPGVAVGVRGGYRPFSAISFELLGEYGYFGGEDKLFQRYNIDQNNDGGVNGNEVFSDASNATYSIQDLRFGPLVRIMTTGTQNRLLFALGAGVLYQWINLAHADYVWSNALQDYDNVGTYVHDYSGFGAFLGLETGYERSVGRLLLGAVFNLYLDNVSSIDEKPYNDAFNFRLGLSFRIGYSAFKLEQLSSDKKP